MARINNLRIYHSAARGQRVFTVAAEHARAVAAGLRRLGYKVSRKCVNGRSCEIVITKL